MKTGIADVRCINVMVTAQNIIFHGCLKIARNHVISVQWLNHQVSSIYRFLGKY